MVNTLHAQVATRVHSYSNADQRDSNTAWPPAQVLQAAVSDGDREAGSSQSRRPTPLQEHDDQAHPTGAGGRANQEYQTQFSDLFTAGNPSWTVSVTDMDLFDSGLDLTELDWDAVALTLDLPS